MKKRIISVVVAVSIILTCFIAVQYSVTAASTEKQTSAAQVNGITDSNDNATILQCWNWSYANLKKEIPKVAAQGFSVVQISPPNEIKEGTKGHTVVEGNDDKNGWWMFYQPAGFQINESTDNALGTKTELIEMVEEAHKYGVRVIADSVINHMGTCNNESSITSQNPMDHLTPKAATFEPEIVNGKLFHTPWKQMQYLENPNEHSRYDSTYDLTRNCTSRLPDLKTESPVVQGAIYDYLKELVDAGIDGFRFDAAKHIETPTDIDSLKSSFWTNTLTKVKTYAKNTYKKDLLAYGEILNTCGVGRPWTSYCSLMKVTDSSLFWQLSDAINNRNAAIPQNIQMSGATKAQAVLWDESHDTYMDANTSGFSVEKRNKLWAITAGRDGITSLYFARPSTTVTSNKATLKNGLKSIKMGDAKETDWATSKAVAGINKLNNIYAGKGEYISNSYGVTVIERGTNESNGGVLLVNMQGTTKSVSSIELKKKKVPDGKYKDAVSGGSFTVSSGKVSGSIGNTGIAVIYPESMEPTQPATEAPTTVTTAPPTDAPTTVAPTTTAPIVTEPPTTTAPASKFEKGDVNRDGDVNIKDATMIQKYLVKLFTLDDEQKWLADFDGDGRVSIKDATKIQYKLAGML